MPGRATVALALVSGALAIGAIVMFAPDVGAAPQGACRDANGVTVVVDFGSLGGGVQVGCAPGDPDSGFAALVGAGFTVDGAAKAPSFLCRVDNKPAPREDPCVNPPPPWAYWSYWIADRGGSWCYSDVGMLGRDPQRGTVEGWSFVSGSAAGSVHAPRSGTFSALPGAGTVGRDCDAATTATTVPTTRAPTTRKPSPGKPPATTPPAPGRANPGPATSGGSAQPPSSGVVPPPAVGGAPDPGSRDGDDPGGASGDPEVAGATTVAGPTTTTTADPTTSSSKSSDDAGADAEGSGTNPKAGDSHDGDPEHSRDEEATSTVALADSGRSGPGSLIGVGVGVGTIGAVGAAAVVVNRRRMHPVEEI